MSASHFKPTATESDPNAPTVVFFHAHPDDEAIFTGGTIRQLANLGRHITLVCATSGEGGRPAAEGETGHLRQTETKKAAELLGVDELLFLGYEDSGLVGEVETGFAHKPVDGAAKALADALEPLERPIEALVTYDSDGIYGHPDHVQVHRVGKAAAEHLAIDCIYEATVDREYLHFVETHVVVEAGLGERPENYGLASTHIGRSTLEISTTVEVSAELDVKRSAMAAHASQLPADASVFQLDRKAFAAVYGQEWYLRSGPVGVLDTLDQSRPNLP